MTQEDDQPEPMADGSDRSPGAGPPPAPRILARTALWIAIDKPSGLPSRPNPGYPWNALGLLESWLREHNPGPHPPGVVHRLDRETSGVLLFSLDPEAHRALVRAFASRLVRKEYLALVRGVPHPHRGTIDLALRRTSSGRVVPDRGGQAARTRYETVRRLDDTALLRAHPVTGRMHQVRVHLSARGTPILGDRLYGDRRDARGPGRSGGSAGPGRGRRRDAGGSDLPAPPRLCLHAHRLSLPEELRHGSGIIESPWPGDLERYLGQLQARGE